MFPSPHILSGRTGPASGPGVRRSSRTDDRRGGFALLITITLVAFLVLVVLSLATLTRVETQVAANGRDVAQARENALMALDLALGQLQKHLGPDRRVSARADVTIPAAVPVTAAMTGAQVETLLADYWGGRRNRRWTGAWSNGNATVFDEENPAAFNPRPALGAWLVSGNEPSATGDTYTPDEQVDNLTLAGITSPNAALARFGTATRPYRLLVGAATANITVDADVDRAVVAPEVPILATGLPGFDNSETTVGHYAWWVGDEGVKARANLRDEHADVGTTVARLARLRSAQRPAVEAMSEELKLGYPVNHADLPKVLDPRQLGMIGLSADLPDELKSRYHDLTCRSRGVLADAKHGGLKSDLSYVFGQPDIDTLHEALTAVYGTADIVPEGAPDDSKGNPLLSTVATPFAALPSVLPDPTLFDQSATWEQLWSFANQGATIDASGAAPPRRHTAIQHGLYPLVVQAKLFFRLRFVGGTADGDGVNRTGKIWVDTLPLVVLANPYAVPLAAADYDLVLSGTPPVLAFGPSGDPAGGFPTLPFPSGANPVWWGSSPLKIRSHGIPAGEAQVFMLSASDNPGMSEDDQLDVTNQASSDPPVLTNDIELIAALTYNTDKTLPASGDTHAVLRLGSNNFTTRLYLGYGDAPNATTLLHEVVAMRHYSGGVSNYDTGTVLVVYPTSDGVRQGGGLNTVVNQAASTRYPAPSASLTDAQTLFTLQQAPFYQANYRAQYASPVGNYSVNNHPLERAKRFAKNGAAGTADNTPHPWLLANLMLPEDGSPVTRWGLVNVGEGQDHTEAPSALVGDAGFKNLLYDLPRPGAPLSSPGSLQHFNTTGFGRAPEHGWQVNYPIANSYPHPRVPRDRVIHYQDTPSLATGQHYDGSYLWNDILWDRFHFSTYPHTGGFDFATGKLINNRLKPFRHTIASNDTTAFRGDGDPSSPANVRIAAANLLVDGAFNINSTSVEAWQAMFSSLGNIPVGSNSAPSAPFVRTLTPPAGSTDAATGANENAWAGFRDLTPAEVKTLAEEMVLQVRLRGPFLSMSQFVNRLLIEGASDNFKLGLAGALQAALDKSVNLTANIAPDFRVPASTRPAYNGANAIIDQAYVMPTSIVGFPGHVLQADVLSALGSTLSARSDTFTIRAYGDSVNPATGEVTGRAWCEAVVQRGPDYVDDALPPVDTPAAGSVNATFGRRFEIVGFRWLNPEDL